MDRVKSTRKCVDFASRKNLIQNMFSDGPRPLHLDSPTSENTSEAIRPKPALVSKKSNDVNNLTEQLKKNGQFKKMKKESKKPPKKIEIKKNNPLRRSMSNIETSSMPASAKFDIFSPRNTGLSRRNSENNLKSNPVTQINEKFSKALGKFCKWIDKLKSSKEKKSVVAPPPPMLKNTPKFDYFKGGPLSEAHRKIVDKADDDDDVFLKRSKSRNRKSGKLTETDVIPYIPGETKDERGGHIPMPQITWKNKDDVAGIDLLKEDLKEAGASYSTYFSSESTSASVMSSYTVMMSPGYLEKVVGEKENM